MELDVLLLKSLLEMVVILLLPMLMLKDLWKMSKNCDCSALKRFHMK